MLPSGGNRDRLSHENKKRKCPQVAGQTGHEEVSERIRYNHKLLYFRWMILPIIPTLIVFWALSVYGIANIETDLSVQKLALPDSRLVEFKNEYDKSLKVRYSFLLTYSEYRFRRCKRMQWLWAIPVIWEIRPNMRKSRYYHFFWTLNCDGNGNPWNIQI